MTIADMKKVTYESAKTMSKKQRRDIMDEAAKILDMCSPSDKQWDIAYDCYFTIEAVEDDEYQQENIVPLSDFYEKHIKGHTRKEYNLGNEIMSLGYDMWPTLDERNKIGVSYIFDEKVLPIYIDVYQEENPQYSKEELFNAFELACSVESYSDWYKECYGVRPRNLFN